MSQYEAVIIDGKTVWIPLQQEAQSKPPQAKHNPIKRYAAKRTGKRYGERKTWW